MIKFGFFAPNLCGDGPWLGREETVRLDYDVCPSHQRDTIVEIIGVFNVKLNGPLIARQVYV